MSADIVERLKQWADGSDSGVSDTLREAAAELERLRACSWNAAIDEALTRAKDISAPFPSPTADEIIRSLEDLRKPEGTP